MYFQIQFRGQLRRTRPGLVSFLESSIAASARAAGGVLESRRKALGASFDEDRIGFWLDLLIFLERAYRALKKAAPELYGYALVLSREASDKYAEKYMDSSAELSMEAQVRKLCRLNSGRDTRGSTGIWFSEEILDKLEFYITTNRPIGNKRGNIPAGFRELKKFRSFESAKRRYPHRDKIKKILTLEGDKNTLLLGFESADMKDGIYNYCTGILGENPPLVIRFVSEGTDYETGGLGLVSFIDAFTPRLRSFIADAASEAKIKEKLEELDALHAMLFMERLREEWLPGTIKRAKIFLRSLLAAYFAATKTRSLKPVLILEDITLAGFSARVFIDVYSSLKNKGELLVLGVDSNSKETSESSQGGNLKRKELQGWKRVFSRILLFTSEDSVSGRTHRNVNPQNTILQNAIPWDDIPKDLLEIIYCIFLFGRYFPSHLFPQLFQEAGLNPDVYSRVLKILLTLGVITSMEDPQPFVSECDLQAWEISPELIGRIHVTVRDRLLFWARNDRLGLCYNLLKILSGLGECVGGVLVLKSLRADVHNGTYKGIEEAIKEGSFASVVGEENTFLLGYIYKTLKALVWGGSEEIQQAFGEPVPPSIIDPPVPRADPKQRTEGSRQSPTLADEGDPFYVSCLAKVHTSLAAFHIGSFNPDAASEALRKALFLNRDLREDPAPAYRLFSLLNFSRQRTDDALEYITFAMEQSEKTGQKEEIFLSCYYASSINLVYGNLFWAEQLAAKAEETALMLGYTNWGMRARFLKGRVSFEIGRYKEALEVFISVDSMRSKETSWVAGPAGTAGEMASTLKAWINRTKFFLGHFPSRNEDTELSGPGFWLRSDAAIFAIEAAYYSSDFKKAEILAEDFLSHSEENLPELQPGQFHSWQDFLYTEQPDWRSGFSQCEFLFQPEKLPGTKLVRIYRAMAQCALHPSLELRKEILDRMQRFMRDELLPGTDPNDGFYFFAWYSMLKSFQNSKDTLASQVDLYTVVNTGFKRLQRRANRIDDTKTKQEFLNLPHWNNAICQAAREYNLV